MDDFLHNLRSGKLKQPDRSNRSYNDQQYKSGQRRPMVDRRKRDYDNKESFERLNVLKDVLENLADSQKKIADAMETRNQVEIRKANALEILAKNVLNLINPNAVISDIFTNLNATADQEPIAAESNTSELSAEMDTVEETETENLVEEDETSLSAPEQSDTTDSKNNLDNQIKTGGKLTAIGQQTLYPIINRMREKGESWERIARHISDKGYPTVSGKGQWRGVMVKNIYEKLAS